ncbi:uncharacterized protein LOC129914775 [Episyrphus balteatus]|uniref:uncharacterized protein LOC129914775 n=1 Tax=Episyrphus balteatus TaxID=286459 RepID=UPI00248646EA|nr:uncharacterized protein LOC129914775 [Episyrphus balteatus]
MINKLLLNNQIITNKKKIQQARIQTINKLVQKIRRLKTLNEKKPQNAKITKNLEKIPKILVSLKKLKVADIIRKILTCTKKPSAILTNGQATPDDVAIALLACNKILVAIVETLRILLNLNDTNSGWQNEIMELSKRKKKILETGQRKKNKNIKSDKKQPKVLVKKLPWKEENLDNTETEQIDNNVNVVVPAKGWKIEPIGDASAEASLPKKIVKNKPEKVDKKPKFVVPSNEHDSDKESIHEKPITTVDPFFFTESGDNYVSTVVIDRVQPEPIQDGLIRRERRDNTIRPNKRNNIFRRQSFPNADGFEDRRQSVQSGRIDKRQVKLSQNPTTTDEKLHPSWAAKQKLKPAITEFKGHKITFDNEGNDTAVKSFNKPSKATNHQNKATVSSDENIHPSWAAKQKLKPAITEFKGTKITFDD